MAIRTHPMPVSTTPQQHNLLQLPGKLAKKSEAIRKEKGKALTINRSLSVQKKKPGSTLESKMWPKSRLKVKCIFFFCRVPKSIKYFRIKEVSILSKTTNDLRFKELNKIRM